MNAVFMICVHPQTENQNVLNEYMQVINKSFAFILFSFTLFVLFGCSANSQSVTNTIETESIVVSPTPRFSANDNNENISANKVSIKINDVEIGTPYENVIRQLGKPLSRKIGGENACGGKKTVLSYSGLDIALDDDGKQNIVVFIKITSPKWEFAPNSHIGANIEDIKAKFGQTRMQKKEADYDLLIYPDGDGGVIFYFRNNKLVKVERDLNQC